MTTATMRLIEAVERLNMSGEIGDGMVATLHDLAAGARLEQNPADAMQALQRYNRAETRLRRARDAMDASTLGGRSRITEAFRPQQGVIVVDGGRCRNCGCPR